MNRNETGFKSVILDRTATSQDLALWGLEDVAYVKMVTVNEETGFSIHSADGSNIGFAPERILAFAAIAQNDLRAMSVH